MSNAWRLLMNPFPALPCPAALLAEGAEARSPSWERLSTASVPDSIKMLATKYDSAQRASLPPGLTPPVLGATPQPTGAAQGSAGGREASSSPALAPTPHAELSGWQRNNLYESPSEAAAAAAARRVLGGEAGSDPEGIIAAVLGPLLQATAASLAGAASAGAARSQPLLGAPLSPFSGAVRLDPSVMPRAGAPAAGPSPAGGLSPASDLGAEPGASPAQFGGLEGGQASSPDIDLCVAAAVPRDAEGVPRFTPPTVTTFRGNNPSPRRCGRGGGSWGLTGSCLSGGWERSSAETWLLDN